MTALPRSGFHLRKSTASGFTLVELLIASSIVAFFICGSLLAMTQLNRYAFSSRLRTLALAATQQRIDEVLTTAWNTSTGLPAVLAAGTKTNNLTLNDDVFNKQSGLSSPMTEYDAPVAATRRTVVTAINARTARAIVTTTYIYHGTTYSVSLSTLRVTDSI